MQRRSFLTLSALAAAAGATAPLPANAKPSASLKLPHSGEVLTGGSRMIDIGNGHHVWTKKVGDAPIKVLLLHGGPGADHCYFECFEDFLPQNGIEFYYYDQLDSGNSDKPNDPSLWTIERYRDEVETVRKALGLEDFYLLGHSWGGMLAIEYALAYPKHLKGLIISNMEPSIPDMVKYENTLRAKFPPEDLAILEKYEKTGEFDNPEYQRVTMEQFYNQHICRINPWPEPFLRSFSHLNEKLYNYFQGPNEFIVTGTFKDWDRWADLPNIKTRTLVMGAKYDEMNPDDMRKMATVIPNATAWISENGSHLAMYDDQFPYFKALLTFLKST